jgi:UDP-N-acetylmuramoyl-L-alanyl-D-glutamate--2,6-diaminopimelate ligase
MKELIKKFIPSFLISWYHFSLAALGAFFYRFPSRKLKVIGVTGTKGKTTTCNLIAQILNSLGFKTGMATTVNFRIGDREWINTTKQTMLGRFQLQKLLTQMAKEGCGYAVVETSSEGILQHRHRFIDYDIAVFTNLSPEHIERHGSFENYRAAKVKLFEKVSRQKQGIGIYNLDDENVDYFLKYPMAQKYGYTLKEEHKENIKSIAVNDVQLSSKKTKFRIDNLYFETKLIGEFNTYNVVAAVCLAVSQGIEIEKIKEVLSQAKAVPGRLEVIDQDQNFTVIVDYSYEPTSLENALKTVKIFNPARIIVVFGSAAGGRDKWRRAAMGKIADKYTDLIIVTTDDPYDEKPEVIVDDILKEILRNKERVLDKNVFRIIDRREAIKKALSLAQENDLILFAGKGGEVWMNLAKGKKIPWKETEIVRQELEKINP